METLKSTLKDVVTSELFVKAANTFWQAALAVLLLNTDALIDLVTKGDWNGIRALAVATLIGALSAGLSAVKTFLRAQAKS